MISIKKKKKSKMIST